MTATAWGTMRLRPRDLPLLVGAGLALVVACGAETVRPPAHRPEAAAEPPLTPTASFEASDAPPPPSEPEEPPLALSLGPTPPAIESPPPVDPDALRVEELCADSRSRVVQAVSRLWDVERGAHATLEDLEPEPPRTDGAFLGDVGPGYWGPADVDGDGADDRVMRYSSVDSWSHFFFLKKGKCLSYAGKLDGYQVEISRAKGRPTRARVHTYPIGPSSRVETHAWSGSSFRLLSP